ncbi:hypothetical protein [Octadecabacter antarcticus]|nr:hypothetical protein [Octadecabacter antarcticus]
MSYPYQRQRRDSGELIVSASKESERLTADQIRRIEAVLVKSLTEAEG